MNKSDFHQSSDSGTPFPQNRAGSSPLWWFAEASYAPDKVLALYNQMFQPYFPVASLDSPRAILSEEDAWAFWDELIMRHLAKPTHRFEEPSKSQPSQDDKWVTFRW
ncbi:hypothetical protein [Bifidobacterium sp. ESL0825]|uniref:hypothetical protein n=1 Tax=Bifidobacterium sp. ESL0825 TaxID=3448587 RepID=UPI0040412FE7